MTDWGIRGLFSGARGIAAARVNGSSRRAAFKLRRMGDRCRNRRNWQQARENYSRYLAIVPEDAAIWVQYGHACKELGDLGTAEEAYRKAAEIAPQDADARFWFEQLRGHKLSVPIADIDGTVTERDTDSEPRECDASHTEAIMIDSDAAMPSFISRQDVINGYNLFLGRQPENEEVIESHLAQNHDIWRWVSVVTGSEEGKRNQLNRVASAYIEQTEARQIEVDISPDALQPLLQHVTTAWSRLGNSDPYWSVLNSEKYRSSTISKADVEEFYRSGAHDAALFETICARNSIVIDHKSTIFDLGCGVGRIGEHFSRCYGRYIGVDISTAHLQIAQQRFINQSIDNARLMLLSNFLADDPLFDIFFSVITLQHCPPPIIYYLLRYCLARLRPGGCAFFQLPCHLNDYKFRLTDYLSTISSISDMEMHALPQSYVFRAFAECNLLPIEVLPYPVIGPIGFSYAFLARKLGEEASKYGS